MTEVIDQEGKDSETNGSDESQARDSSDSNQTEKEKTRSQVVSKQIVTEIVTEEQPADKEMTQIILIVFIASLCLILVVLTVLCIIKRRKQTNPGKISAQDANQEDANTSFEDNQKPQYNAKDHLDILNIKHISSKRETSSQPPSSARSMNSQNTHASNNCLSSRGGMLSYGNEDVGDDVQSAAAVKPNRIEPMYFK